MSMLPDLTDFLRRHDLTIDLFTVWTLCLGFYIYALVKFVSWSVLRSQHDQTMVGATLKRQKLAETALGLSMGTLYGMTLMTYYCAISYEIWVRSAVRFGIALVIILGGIYGLQFTYYLLQETRRGRKDYI